MNRSVSEDLVQPPHQLHFILSSQVVPQNQYHSPPVRPQVSCDLSVTALVMFQLLFPICPIRRRRLRMLWACMPETSIDKNCDSLRSENEIGPSESGLMPTPPLDAMAFEHLHQAISVALFLVPRIRAITLDLVALSKVALIKCEFSHPNVRTRSLVPVNNLRQTLGYETPCGSEDCATCRPFRHWLDLSERAGKPDLAAP